MVFQDGHSYLNDFRVPIVFDNLIHKKAVPVLIGLFINPGHTGSTQPDNPWQSNNRSYEYDSLGDEYVQFLIEEMIPEVGNKYFLADDAKMRAICGISSGGICSFTAAWQRPDYFHKVMSHLGSFTDIRGGHVYPTLIRKSAKRDIRVFLQDGSNDLDLRYGNWWLSNLQMESALKFREYDHKFIAGTGEHNAEHGAAILPESLEWLWRQESS
jgi:enterochelin esterase family protein